MFPKENSALYCLYLGAQYISLDLHIGTKNLEEQEVFTHASGSLRLDMMLT